MSRGQAVGPRSSPSLILIQEGSEDFSFSAFYSVKWRIPSDLCAGRYTGTLAKTKCGVGEGGGAPEEGDRVMKSFQATPCTKIPESNHQSQSVISFRPILVEL